MPTTNINLSGSWSKIAADGEDFLASWNTAGGVEFASTAADSAPTVVGHVLRQSEAMTRAAIGAGYVWARAIYSDPVRLVVSK